MDAGEEQCLAGIDVTYPHDNPAIHDQVLDGDFPLARDPIEILSVKILREGLGTEGCKEGVGFRGTINQHHETESARVMKAQNPVAKTDLEMVMLAKRLLPGSDTQTAGHPQMHHERLRADIQQQILAAAGDRAHDLAAKPAGQIVGNRVAQARLVYGNRADLPVENMGFNTAARGFDFGQFRHLVLDVVSMQNARCYKKVCHPA